MCRLNVRYACRPLLAVALSAVLASTPLFAQQPPSPTFVVGKLADAAEAPVIDGKVNEAVWQTVQPYATFTQQDPIEGAAASEKTEVRMIVGQGNVYVSIIAFDRDPSKIIVSQARRDASLSETDSNRIYIRTMTTGNLNACRAAIHIYNLPGEVDHLLASVRHVSENAGRYMTTAQAR